MKKLTDKFDDTSGPTGEYIADEFNDLHDDAQNAVTGSGQTLTVAVGDNNEQLMNAIGVGGRRKSRADAETADVGDIVLPDNSSGSLTIKLPLVASLFVNATVVFEQVIDQLYSVNSLTIDRNGEDIMGLAEDMVVDSSAADNIIFKMTWKAGSVGWLVSRTGTVGTTL